MLVHTPSRLKGPVSSTRRWWTQLRDVAGDAPIRTELVERVRREIAAGTYDTPVKFEQALSRLFDEMER